MAISQFDVFPNPVRQGRQHKPFVISLQHRHLDHLHTRVAAPLVTEIRGSPSRLNPVFVIGGQRVFLDPTDLDPDFLYKMGNYRSTDSAAMLSGRMLRLSPK